jgi:hypothetical protein
MKLVKQVTGEPVSLPGVSYAAFNDFTRSAKQAATIYAGLEAAVKAVYESCPSAAIDRGKSVLEDYERSGRHLIQRCQVDAKTFDPDDAYDDHGEITKGRVSKHIALLIGSFPNANPADPETYTKMLIEEVVAAVPMATTLEAACRKVRRTAKFLPTISEVLAAIKEEERAWQGLWDAINYADMEADTLRKKLEAESARRLAAELASAQALPLFAPGDRVSHDAKFGQGTVVDVDGNKISVVFDAQKSVTRKVVADFLTRVAGERT